MSKGLSIFALCLAIGTGALAQTAVETYNEGNALGKAGKWEQAAQKYEAATQADPNLWQAYMGLGNAYHNLGRDTEALKAYDKSLSLHPDNPTLKAYVEKIQGTQSAAPSSTAPSSSGPGTKGLFMNYSIGYDFAFPDEMNKGLKGRAAFLIDMFGYTEATTSDSNSAIATALEFGVMLDPQNSISLEPSFRLAFEGSLTSSSDDYNETFAPHMMGLIVKYGLLIPMGQGNDLRLSLGGGWYHAIVDWHYQPDTTLPYDAKGAYEGDTLGAVLGISDEIDLGGGIALGITAKGRLARFDKVTAATLIDNGVGVGPGPYALVVNDYNSDGKMDITFDAVANVDGTTVKYVPIDLSGIEGNISLKAYF